MSPPQPLAMSYANEAWFVTTMSMPFSSMWVPLSMIEGAGWIARDGNGADGEVPATRQASAARRAAEIRARGDMVATSEGPGKRTPSRVATPVLIIAAGVCPVWKRAQKWVQLGGAWEYHGHASQYLPGLSPEPDGA